MRFYQLGAWGLCCLCFKTTKVQGFLHCCYPTLFPLSGFCFFTHAFMVFQWSTDVTISQTLASSLSLARWGRGRWRVRGEGVP